MLKMNIKKWASLSILTLLGLGNYFTLPTVAVNFNARSLESNKVIALAQPSSRGNYSLIILEQISNQRLCWQEEGNNPIRVRPLLLEFDFTGICGRSTDSNGYSVRVGGEDLAWQYRLQIIQERNNLKLVAVSTRDRSIPPIEIGRTNGISNDLSKIILNEGWSFSKRVYNGQTLGHIYLTHNDNINNLIANSSSTYRSYSSRNIPSNNTTISNNSSAPSMTVNTNSSYPSEWIEFSSDNNNNRGTVPVLAVPQLLLLSLLNSIHSVP